MMPLARSPKKKKRADNKTRKVKPRDLSSAQSAPMTPGPAATPAGSIEVIDRAGASSEQKRLWVEVFGPTSRLATASHASIPSLKLARQETLSALVMLLELNPSRPLRFWRLDLGHEFDSSSSALDFRKLKKAVIGHMRRHFDDALCTMRPTLAGNALGTSAFVIGSASDTPGRPIARRFGSAEPLRLAVEVETIVDADGLKEAVACMWSWTALDPYPKGHPVVQSDATAGLRCHAARLLTPIDRCLFGTGRGKGMASKLGRILRIRAELLDIAQLSPLRPEGVASFLAALPISANDRLPLPVISLP